MLLKPPPLQHSSISGRAAAAVPAGGADARAVVPWLVLAGHCLGIWALELSKQLRITPELLVEVQQLTPEDIKDLVTGPYGVEDEDQSGEQHSSDSESDTRSASSEQSDTDGTRAAHKQLVARLVRFLRDGSPAAQQLAAAGYAVAAPLAPLQAVSVLAAWQLYLFR